MSVQARRISGTSDPYLGAMRTQLANPVVSSNGPGLLAEARHTGAVADVLYSRPLKAAVR